MALKEAMEKNLSFEMTWGSTTSSGYCSQDDSDSEMEQFFTARTSFFIKVKRKKIEPIDWGKQVLSVGDIQQKNRDRSYTGFIRVLFKLTRPVSLPPARKASSPQEEGQQEGEIKHRTSFYLPKDTAKHLHISSQTRAREVIEALLNKFTVVDNPAKFALFERSERENQIYLRKLSDDERPLHLRLCAGPNEKVLSLVLKENETGEVNWDAFSFPELRNFLRILQREEEEHVRQIVKRYALARDRMKEAMASITTPG